MTAESSLEYVLRLRKTTRKIPARGVDVRLAAWRICYIDPQSYIGLYRTVGELLVPCKATLHKFLTGLVLDWNWQWEGDKRIPESQAKYLQIIFKHQREYKLWKQAFDILRTKGKDAAWEWIADTAPLLLLKQKLNTEGDEE